MNEISPADTLLWEALPDLTLNIAQTASLCGISVRQLGYWTRQGYVSASGDDARRAYGLEAIRRVLAIRKAMEAGASLRQSLRQVSSPPLAPVNGNAAPTAPASPLPPQASTISGSLADFFSLNPHTRDHAGGLAVKLGWAEEDVRRAADDLCASGLLSCSVCQGMTVFYRAKRELAYA